MVLRIRKEVYVFEGFGGFGMEMVIGFYFCRIFRFWERDVWCFS